MKKVLWTLIVFVLFMTVTNAASYNISVGYKGLTKGGSTTLTISGSDVTGRFNIRTSDASVISVSEGSVWIENNSYNVTLTALKVGNATITVTPAAGTSDGSGNPVDLGSKSIGMSVYLPREKSSNNNLKSLSVEGYELDPKFDKDKLEYTVSVPATVEKIKINAEKADGYASLEGTGEFEVVEGKNEFEVKVTSETGKEKIYKVNVMVEDKNPITVSVDGKSYTVVKNAKSLTAPEKYDPTTVTIGTNSIPGFYNEKTKYKLVGLKDDAGNISLFIYENGNYKRYDELKSKKTTIVILDYPKVLDGYIEKEIDIDGVKVKALVVKDSSRFAVVYGMNVSSGNKAYYQYDIKGKTLSRYNDEMIKTLLTKNKTYSYIIMGSAVGCALFFMLTIVLAVSNSKKKKLIKKVFEKSEADAMIKKDIVKKNINKDKKEIEEIKESANLEKPKEEEKIVEEPIKKEKKKAFPKEEEKEPIKEEVKDTTEVYDIFEDEKKARRKKSKK